MSEFTPFIISIDSEQEAQHLQLILDAANRYYGTQAQPSLQGSAMVLAMAQKLGGAMLVAQSVQASVAKTAEQAKAGRKGNGRAN